MNVDQEMLITTERDRYFWLRAKPALGESWESKFNVINATSRRADALPLAKWVELPTSRPY